MVNWLVDQFLNLNVFMLVIMIIFVTSMSKANTQKMLKEQSKELHADFEELKDTMRDVNKK